MYNAQCAETLAELASIGIGLYGIVYNAIYAETLAELASIGIGIFGIVYNANYADTLAELGSIGTAQMALCAMPIMPTHMLNWEVLGLHNRHCLQCQLCRHTC